MKHTFTREQIKRIIIEELERSRDEEEAEELLRQIVGLKEDAEDEFIKKRVKARKFRERAGISMLAAVALLFGGVTGLSTSQKQAIQPDIEKVQQLDDETLKSFGVDVDALKDPSAAAEKHFSKGYPTAELGLVDLSDMDNTQRVEAAWKIIDDMVEDGKLNYEYARVASTLPGGMAALDYNDIPPNIPLPNSLKSKDQYRKWVVERVLEGDIANLPELENFVFGNTGKWPSGSGEDKARTVSGAQVLPPEWSTAYDLYQELTKKVVLDLVQSWDQSDELGKAELLKKSNAETSGQLEKELNDKLTRAGLQRAGDNIISLTVD